MASNMSLKTQNHTHQYTTYTNILASLFFNMANVKTYHPTLHFTPWSLNLFIRVPFQLSGEHTVLQPFRRIQKLLYTLLSLSNRVLSFN